MGEERSHSHGGDPGQQSGHAAAFRVAAEFAGHLRRKLLRRFIAERVGNDHVNAAVHGNDVLLVEVLLPRNAGQRAQPLRGEQLRPCQVQFREIPVFV